MERYYFIVDGAATLDDKTGTVLTDDQATRQYAEHLIAEAEHIIAELKADGSFSNSSGQMIVMRGDQEIFRIPLSSGSP
jgi:hypothetical protein